MVKKMNEAWYIFFHTIGLLSIGIFIWWLLEKLFSPRKSHKKMSKVKNNLEDIEEIEAICPACGKRVIGLEPCWCEKE